MYPLHLENQTARVFGKICSRKFQEINREILSEIKKELESSKLSTRHDSADSLIRLDSAELDRLLSDVRNLTGLSDSERRQMVKSMASLDAWARSSVKSQIDGQLAAMNNPPRRPGVIRSNRSNFRVPVVQFADTETEQVLSNLKNQINQNFDTVSVLFKEHGDTVRNLVKESIAKGTSYADLAKEIENKTGVNERRADMWARDQSQRFVSEQETIRAKNAGFPGFYWGTQRDSRVRDTHRFHNGLPLDGQYFFWDDLPVLNRAGTGMPGPLEPGQDYRCRCFKRLGFPPDSATKQKLDRPFEDQKFENLKKIDSKHEALTGAFPKQNIFPKPNGALKKYHEKIENMSRLERIRFVDRSRFSTYDQTNLDQHIEEFTNRGVTVKKKYGVELDEMVDYILKGNNYDNVATYIHEGAETVGFLNVSLGIFVAVAASRNRIKTVFPVTEEWIDKFYKNYRLLL